LKETTSHWQHGRRKDFFHGGPVGDFPKIFFSKVVKFGFPPLEIEKTTFFASNFKFQGWPRHPLPPFLRPWLATVFQKTGKMHAYTTFLKRITFIGLRLYDKNLMYSGVRTQIRTFWKTLAWRGFVYGRIM